MKKIFLIALLCMITLLGGCTSNVSDETYTINVVDCMQYAGLSPSVKGENITYYYESADEISLYYAQNWKKGIISWKRFFKNEEQYNLQKQLYPNAECRDKELTIQIKEYMKVNDMDAHWNSVEESSIYTLIK